MSPAKRKALLVTHPVDLGNRVIAEKYVTMLELHTDLEHFSFDPEELQRGLDGQDTDLKSWLARARSSIEARPLIREAHARGRVVVFQSISAALFTYPWFRGHTAYIMTDWTRKLYEPIREKKMSPKPLTYLHRFVLNSATGLIGVTDAVLDSFRNDYGISPGKLHKGRMPFDVSSYLPSPDRDDSQVRMLFVGGDFHRKGGDILLNWYETHAPENVKLTIVTQSDVRMPGDVRLVKNDPRFSPKEEFSRQDLFVLPSRLDSYPQVLGEAACAGLGIVSTPSALGAREVIDEGENGFIVESEEELHRILDRVVSDSALLCTMKRKSRAKMVAQFTFAACFSQIEDVLFARQ